MLKTAKDPGVERRGDALLGEGVRARDSVPMGESAPVGDSVRASPSSAPSVMPVLGTGISRRFALNAAKDPGVGAPG